MKPNYKDIQTNLARHCCMYDINPEKSVTEQLAASRPESSSYTLSLLKDKGVQPGEAANCNNRGITRRRQNQLMMEIVILQTLKYTLMLREEQAWDCPACRDSDGDGRY